MKWTDKYNVYKAECGILTLQCAWGRDGYTVRVNDKTLKKTFREIGEAQAAAIEFARRLLSEASAALDA